MKIHPHTGYWMSSIMCTWWCSWYTSLFQVYALVHTWALSKLNLPWVWGFSKLCSSDFYKFAMSISFQSTVLSHIWAFSFSKLSFLWIQAFNQLGLPWLQAFSKQSLPWVWAFHQLCSHISELSVKASTHMSFQQAKFSYYIWAISKSSLCHILLRFLPLDNQHHYSDDSVGALLVDLINKTECLKPQSEWTGLSVSVQHALT